MNHPHLLSGWWFGTFFIFHNIWDNPSYWLIFFKMLKTTNQITVFFPPPLIRGCSNLTWIQPVSHSCGGGWVDETVCDRQSSPRRSIIPHVILKNTRNKNSQYWRMSKKSTSTVTPKKIEPWLFAILVGSYFSFSFGGYFVFFTVKGFSQCSRVVWAHP